jgi:hypothetical protein
MAAQWHYGQGEEQHGPVPLEELKQLVASGQVQPTDMVWNADMPEWLPAGEVEELFPKRKTASEQVAAEPAREPSPSGASRQPADAVATIPKVLSSRRNVIGIAAVCGVVLIVVVFLLFSGSRKQADKSVAATPVSEAAKEQQPAKPPAETVAREKQPPEVEQLPDGSIVVARRVGSHPDADSYQTKSTHLSLEVTKSGKDTPEKPNALGSGVAGLELKGARLLELKVKASSDLEGANEEKKVNKNIFAGFMVDYQTAEGYAKRVALCLTAFSKERDVKAPGWGKNSVPDDYMDIGKKDSYQLDLQKWAPPGWTGQVWFGVVLQQHKPNTYLKAELSPHVASQETGSPK